MRRHKNESTQIEKKTFIMASNSVLKISTHLEMKFREPPRTSKDVLRALELIKDNYNGFPENLEIIMVFYVLSGFTCKYLGKLGQFYIYKSTLAGVFNVKMDKIKPLFPLKYHYDGEDIGLLPNFLVSFNLEAEPSLISPISLCEYITPRSPPKYRKRSHFKASIFNNYPVKVTIKRDTICISKITN